MNLKDLPRRTDEEKVKSEEPRAVIKEELSPRKDLTVVSTSGPTKMGISSNDLKKDEKSRVAFMALLNELLEKK